MAETLTLIDPVRDLHVTDYEVGFYQSEGYLLLPGLLRPETVAALREAVLEVLAADGRDLTASKLTQSSKYVAGGPLHGLIDSANLRAMVGRLLGGEAHVYLPFTAVKSARGGGKFDFHQDNQYTRHDGQSLNMWFALEEMTPENGCLVVAPRSHLAGTLEAGESADGDGHRRVLEEPPLRLEVRMRPGDCIAFSRLTVHGSGANHTDQHRVAYAVQFHRHDTRALIDGTWELLRERPRWQRQAVSTLG